MKLHLKALLILIGLLSGFGLLVFVLKWIVTLNPYYAVIIILGCPLTVSYSGIYKNLKK